MAFECFQIWTLSGHVTLPFPGAWIDQPTWIRRAFLTLKQVEHWHSVNETLPTTAGIPKLEDAG